MNGTLFWILMGLNVFFMVRTAISWVKLRMETLRVQTALQLSIAMAQSVTLSAIRRSSIMKAGLTKVEATPETRDMLVALAQGEEVFNDSLVLALTEIQGLIGSGVVKVDEVGRVIVPRIDLKK